MSFNNSYRQVVELPSASHAWIALHRLVEAHGRTVGAPFHVVFDEIERHFGFRRDVLPQWPDQDTMRRAAQWLRAQHDQALARRQALVAARRSEKRRGHRVPVPAELRAIELQTAVNAAATPRVGYWGWRKRREEGR